jgi:hypothetical protein
MVEQADSLLPFLHVLIFAPGRFAATLGDSITNSRTTKFEAHAVLGKLVGLWRFFNTDLRTA